MQQDPHAIPYYRQKGAIKAYQEAQEIMNPVEVQVTQEIVGYLQSGEFISLFVIFFLYRLGRAVVDTPFFRSL